MLTRNGLDRTLRGSAGRGCVRLCPRSPRAASRPSADAAVRSPPRSEPGITALRPLRGSHSTPRHPPIDLSSTHPRIRHPPTEAPEEAGHGNPGSEREPREAGARQRPHRRSSRGDRGPTHPCVSRPPTGAPEGRGMVTPVRSRSRWRRGRDSVHADEAAAETGDPARSPTFAGAPEGATPRLRACTGRTNYTLATDTYTDSAYTIGAIRNLR